MDEIRLNVILTVCICALLAIITLTIGVADVLNTRAYVTNGYEQIVAPGRTSSIWQKSK